MIQTQCRLTRAYVNINMGIKPKALHAGRMVVYKYVIC